MKLKQSPAGVIMVRPAAFGHNDQTAATNKFQQEGADSNVQRDALSEFDKMVEMLRSHDIEVTVFEDSTDDMKPDAVFPNNWLSLHEDGKIILYPMLAENRRLERRQDILEYLKANYLVTEVVDLSKEEEVGKYLEGTGSIVFDHVNKVMYACRSARTHEGLAEKVGTLLGYRTVLFDAFDAEKNPIYHTNVLLSIGEQFVVICLDAIPGDEDQENLLDSFSRSNHKVIAISFAQMNVFAGNILEVETLNHEKVVVMSQSAFESLLPGQLNVLSEFADILTIPVRTIERFGGGSVRCMLAGNHLVKK